MLFKVFDSNNNIGKEIEFDELIASIAACNMADDSELETLKAFAIMIRTELARQTDVYGGSGCDTHKEYDICSNPGHCIQYKLIKSEIPDIVKKAVYETKDKIITFEGKPIKPYYHYRCGGATENSENVIDSRINYLRRVLCSHCKNMKDCNAESYFSVGELEQLLDTKVTKNENIHMTMRGIFEDIEVDDLGYVRTIKIGSKTFKGRDVMKTLNLNSARFNYTPVKFLIKAIGMGHGLGLCQCGANEMAKQGKSYQDILNYYYTGIVIEEMQMPESGKPLRGRKFVLDAGHGGAECSDGRGPSGLREKDVNMDIVLQLSQLLENEGAQVVLTRKGDHNIPMVDRAKLSNSVKPNFFISILQSTFASPGVSGTEIYHFRGDKAGEKLSKLVMDEISSSLKTKNRGVRTAEFYLLREVKGSSIIIQLLYITNPQDEAKLADPDFRKKAAEAIYNAINQYYNI